MAGGLAAEAGGGKFANGAVSAAFAQAFNDWHTEQTNSNQTLLFRWDTPAGEFLANIAEILGAYYEANPLAAITPRPNIDAAITATTRVGRWMSNTEYQAMLRTNMVQESFTGTTHVASPATPMAFMNQAKPGSLYVEFNVPNYVLRQTNDGWAKIIGPNSLEGRLALRKGLPIPIMPKASNITHITIKPLH